MKNTRVRTSLMLILLAGLIVGGCAKKPSAKQQPDGMPEKMESELSIRVNDLRRRVEELADHSRRLPGRNEEEHRRIMEQIFADFSGLLPLLYGPQPSGAFRQRLRIIDSAREQLAAGSLNLAAEPTLNTGLRAVYSALAEARDRMFPNQEQLDQSLDELRSQLDELDSIRGPLHRGVVRQTVRQMVQITREMTEQLEERAGGEDSKSEARMTNDESNSNNQ